MVCDSSIDISVDRLVGSLYQKEKTDLPKAKEMIIPAMSNRMKIKLNISPAVILFLSAPSGFCFFATAIRMSEIMLQTSPPQKRIGINTGAVVIRDSFAIDGTKRKRRKQLSMTMDIIPNTKAVIDKPLQLFDDV